MPGMDDSYTHEGVEERVKVRVGHSLVCSGTFPSRMLRDTSMR